MFRSRAENLLKMMAYAMGPGRFYRPAYDALATHVSKVGTPFLEVGCGPGGLVRAVAQCQPNGICVGIDRNPAVVTKARSLTDSSNSGTFEVMEGESMAFDDEMFRCAVGLQSMFHWQDRLAVIREMHRVLLSGGSIMLIQADPDGDIPAGWIKRTAGWPTEGALRYRWGRYRPEQRFLDALPQHLEEVGFSEIEVQQLGFYTVWSARK